MNPKKITRKVIRKSREFVSSGLSIAKEGKYKAITENYDLKGYKRVYLVHIRKTGGTSLNNMFLSLSGEDSNLLYAQLAQKHDHRLLINGKIYVGWNVKYINKGYTFTHFHIPLFTGFPFQIRHLPFLVSEIQ